MAPSIDDPRRLLYAAARWMTAIGWAYAAFGLGFLFLGLRAWQMTLTGACLLAVGTMFLISAPFARRHHTWAVWLGIGTATLGGSVLALLLMVFVQRAGWRDLLGFPSIPSAAAALLLLALPSVHAMIAWTLSNSFDAADAAQGAAPRPGFDPAISAAPRPVLPTGSADAHPPCAR